MLGSITATGAFGKPTSIPTSKNAPSFRAKERKVITLGSLLSAVPLSGACIPSPLTGRSWGKPSLWLPRFPAAFSGSGGKVFPPSAFSSNKKFGRIPPLRFLPLFSRRDNSGDKSQAEFYPPRKAIPKAITDARYFYPRCKRFSAWRLRM
jgi:hypothetical protein